MKPLVGLGLHRDADVALSFARYMLGVCRNLGIWDHLTTAYLEVIAAKGGPHCRQDHLAFVPGCNVISDIGAALALASKSKPATGGVCRTVGAKAANMDGAQRRIQHAPNAASSVKL